MQEAEGEEEVKMGLVCEINKRINNKKSIKRLKNKINEVVLVL